MSFCTTSFSLTFFANTRARIIDVRRSDRRTSVNHVAAARTFQEEVRTRAGKPRGTRILLCRNSGRYCVNYYKGGIKLTVSLHSMFIFP